MYITQDIANRIKSTSKLKQVSMKELLSSCELNINAISEFSKGKHLSCISLGKIADYLDCSVDYLLGRTDTPNSTYTINNKNTTVNGTQANVINHNAVSESVTDTLTEQFIQKFEGLDFSHKIKVINIVNDMVENN